MDYEFFHNMSKAEAKEYFDHFLLEVGEGFESMKNEMESDYVEVDYSIESLPKVLEWAVSKIKTYDITEDESLPDWIRNTKEYQEGLFEYDHDSKILVNRIVYYFGESFVRSFPRELKWGIGNPKYIEKNMPVVKGFSKGVEMAPIIIVDNIMRELIVKKNFGMPRDVVAVWASKF